MDKSYQPYQFMGKPLLINRFLLAGQTECAGQDYDIFDIRFPERGRQILEELRERDYSRFPVFDRLDFGYYNQTGALEGALGRKSVLYTELYCKKQTRVILNFCCSAGGKLWVNGTIGVVQNKPWNETNYLTVFLKEGTNHIVIEQYCATGRELFSLQALDYENEMSGKDPLTSLAYAEGGSNQDGLVLVADSDYLPDEPVYRFMYMANNPELYENRYSIEISDSAAGFIRKLEGELNRPVVLELDSLRNLSPEKLRFETVKCAFKTKSGGERTEDRSLILNDFSGEADRILRENQALAAEISPFTADQLLGKQQNSEAEYDTGSALFWKVWILKFMHGVIRSGQYYSRYFLGFGTHEVYLRSKLDGSLIRLWVRLPGNYDRNREYPLMLTVATSLYSDTSNIFPESRLSEEVIHIDATGRGFTLGSYIAEASILEILEWAKDTYRIDVNRIYGIGFSSGGYAVWALAQNYPDLFAAIYPLGSYPNADCLRNLSNTHVFNIVSDWDNVQAGKGTELKRTLSPYLKYRQYDVKQYLHNHLWRFRASSYILNRMLECVRNPYPRELHFKTYRNRHLRCYWMELHGIRRGAKYAELTAHIYDGDRIEITVRGADGLTVQLPGFLRRDHFSVKINRRIFRFTDYSGSRIVFSAAGGYRPVDDESKPDYTKGTGLLDVYLNKMKIILSDQAGEKEESLAGRFSRPHTNGFVSKIFVDYPICRDADLPAGIWDNNLIVIDAGQNNAFLKRIGHLLPVKVTENGCVYRGKAYDGPCCVMQAVGNPYYPEYSLLVVQTNDAALFDRSVLLRKIVLPSYFSGIHAYWNNQILIQTQKDFYGVYESGGEPVKL